MKVSISCHVRETPTTTPAAPQSYTMTTITTMRSSPLNNRKPVADSFRCLQALRRSIKGEKNESKVQHISITPKSAVAIVPPKKVSGSLFCARAGALSPSVQETDRHKINRSLELYTTTKHNRHRNSLSQRVISSTLSGAKMIRIGTKPVTPPCRTPEV